MDRIQGDSTCRETPKKAEKKTSSTASTEVLQRLHLFTPSPCPMMQAFGKAPPNARRLSGCGRLAKKLDLAQQSENSQSKPKLPKNNMLFDLNVLLAGLPEINQYLMVSTWVLNAQSLPTYNSQTSSPAKQSKVTHHPMLHMPSSCRLPPATQRSKHLLCQCFRCPSAKFGWV